MKRTKICFITPGHFITNPRLIKEAQSLNTDNYEVHIVSTQYVKTLIPLESEFQTSHPKWQFHIFNWSGKIQKKLTSIRKKIYEPLARIHSDSIFLERYINPAYSKQLAMAVKIQASHYIAHNLAALPIAAKAAYKNKVSFSFDAEDFHRGQFTLDSVDSRNCIIIEDKYFKGCEFITTASPLINKAYQALYLALNFHSINNVFPKTEFNRPLNKNQNQNLRLVWFSQTVGKERGLENIFKALNQINDFCIEFHLYGEASEHIKMYFNTLFLNKNHKIVYKGTKSPKELNLSLSNYDIGIASEIATNLNRDICLTNKIISYVQAGLCIIASDTSAQIDFMKEKEIGFLYYKNNIDEIIRILTELNTDRDLLWKFRQNSTKLSETLNWENEKEKFLSLIKK